MPAVHRFEGLRVVIYPNDHRPAHVHVIGKGCEAVFNLGHSAGSVELRENYGFSRKQIRRIQAELTLCREYLGHAWEDVHGIA